MPIIRESDVIAGVYIVELTAHADNRGWFMETFRKEWFPQRSWQQVQTNRSESRAGVLRGLHYHHHQVDYWHVIHGQIRAGLVDLRPGSPTFERGQIVPMGNSHPLGLFIPVGVAHGFAALTNVTLTYTVDNYFDGSDEYGVAWNDPAVGLDWGLTEPQLSPRDAGNPRLHEIPLASRPPYRP